MEKVKVSKEVAEFMESFKTLGDVNWENALLEQHTEVIRDTDATIKEGAKCMLQYSTFEVAQMLVNGYEVEKSPEEQLSAIYNDEKAKLYVMQIMHDPAKYANHKSFMRGVETTLEALGIKIEGINK